MLVWNGERRLGESAKTDRGVEGLGLKSSLQTKMAAVRSLKCQPSPPPNPQGARERETSEFRAL